jgi:hypothetical protein
MRVLLEQQDRLCELQEQLEDCDDAETVQLNLSSRRQDDNRTRREILQQITTELKVYGMNFECNLRPRAFFNPDAP